MTHQVLIVFTEHDDYSETFLFSVPRSELDPLLEITDGCYNVDSDDEYFAAVRDFFYKSDGKKWRFRYEELGDKVGPQALASHDYLMRFEFQWEA